MLVAQERTIYRERQACGDVCGGVHRNARTVTGQYSEMRRAQARAAGGLDSSGLSGAGKSGDTGDDDAGGRKRGARAGRGYIGRRRVKG